ncbi:MAG: helicase-related protein, partial [Proteobacteria bacterium]|nr:helicase-related protein [Pseudomonadota bacterium]
SLTEIEKLALTPTIVYSGKRLMTEKIARLLAVRMPPLSNEQQTRVKQAFRQILIDHHGDNLIQKSYQKHIENTGIAFHHSGLPPPIRASIEALLKKGILRICVATSGLSLGINFSVKSTMIADLQRPGDQGITLYSASDILQMTGRAGRRGKDLKGYSLWPSLGYFLAMAKTRRNPIYPRLKHDATTFLGLVDKGYSLATTQELYQKSFDQYQKPSSRVQLLSYPVLEEHFVSGRELKHKSPLCANQSPAHAYSRYIRSQPSVCRQCFLRSNCHHFISRSYQDPLAKLHLHLHKIGAIGSDDQLTDYGKIAKYLPHSGGLYLAKLISSQTVTLHDLVELMACFSLAHYKSPTVSLTYEPRFHKHKVLRAIHFLYPEQLFSHLYETNTRARHQMSKTAPQTQYIEFHPDAGYLIQLWTSGISWQQITREVTTAYFAEGDLFSLFYKVSNYLQSVHKAHLGDLSDEALRLREYILRPPLDYSYQATSNSN